MNTQIKIGWSRRDTTPQGRCMLAGQMGNRLSEGVLDPLSTTVLALENNGEKVIIISLDAAAFSDGLADAVREKVSGTTGIPGENIMASVTHTHTAPQYGEIVPPEKSMELYFPSPEKRFKRLGNRGIDVEEMHRQYPDFIDSEQYFDFLTEQISAAAIEAWEKRAPGKISYGQGTAVVGECRRLTTADKGGWMYALEDDPAMLHAEGHVDHTVNILSTYDNSGKLTGILVNIACPSQVSEAWRVVSADYWHDVRQEVAARFGEIYLLPQCSCAGDISPHKLLGRKADERMMLLRSQQSAPLPDWKWQTRVYDQDYGLARRKEIARRIAVALEDVLPVIAPAAESAPVLKKVFKPLALPPRTVTKEEAENAAKDIQKNLEVLAANNVNYSGSVPAQLRVIHNYENPPSAVNVELHVLRIGDVVFATNSFEYYLDYGDRIKGASKAVQTFLVQLASGRGSYLPSSRSGTSGYGSWPSSCIVSPDGGDILLKETVNEINKLF